MEKSALHRSLVALTLSCICFCDVCRPTLAQTACTPTVTGHLDILPLTATRKLRVWLPPGYNTGTTKYPVLYLLDGQNIFDACTADNREEWKADETLTALINSHRIEPIVVVAVDYGQEHQGDRAREYLPYPDPFNASVADVHGSGFPAFMEKEVLPRIAAKYRVLGGPDHTAIGGASYGGVAALYALIHRPDLFGAGIVESPSIQIGNGQLLRDTVSLIIGPKKIAIGVGTMELPAFPNAGVAQVTQLAANLKAVAYNPPQVQLTVGKDQYHSPAAWSQRLESDLLFLYKP